MNEDGTTPTTEKRPLTFGEKAVGLTFNPSGDPDVLAAKRKIAEFIDFCNDLRTKAGRGEKGRYLSTAITHAEAAQMFAVKAITWKDDEPMAVAPNGQSQAQ